MRAIYCLIYKKENVFEVSHSHPDYLKTLESIWAKFDWHVGKLLMENADEAKKEDLKKRVNGVRLAYLKFYQKLCTQIKSRINNKDELINKLPWIDHEVAMSGDVINSIAI